MPAPGAAIAAPAPGSASAAPVSIVSRIILSNRIALLPPASCRRFPPPPLNGM